MSRLRRARRLAGGQDGFTMLTVMFTMMALGTFAMSAWALATGDIPMARADQDQKRAYEAAQAGLQWYAYELDRDPTYWTKCATVPAISPGVPAPMNLEGASPRVWRTLPGSNARYTLEIMKRRDANGVPTTACSTSDAVNTTLQNNTLRLRSTGQANGETRTVIATFKRRSFIDFVYFTNSEAQDPLVGGGTDATCSAQRSSSRSRSCTEITFVNPDSVNGPLHTNDRSVLTSGSPITFGRPGKNDAFEVNGPSPGYVGSAPAFKGPVKYSAGDLEPPPGNGGLKTLATPSWTYTGSTCLVFNSNATVDVYPDRNWQGSGVVTCSGASTTRPLTGAGSPPNGVIYIQNDPSRGCGVNYKRYQLYDNPTTCGDVAVSGNYAASVTIGAENDIIVNGDTKQQDGSDSMLGLIATGFVRIYHPIQGETSSSCGDNSTPSGFIHVKEVDAAILSLAHSFMVDNYHCGGSEGKLTVKGAIAQWYRGVVGTGNGDTGYIKDYNYDDRLKIREPPNFLDPIKTSWRVVRQTEQKPATSGP